jgi:hypothetical protein
LEGVRKEVEAEASKDYEEKELKISGKRRGLGFLKRKNK